jgi:hypothetical protein
MTNRIFFPQAMLDILVQLEKIDLDGEQIVLTDGGYHYTVEEGVHVTREVTTGEDPARLCGKVKSRAELAEQLGAELLGSSMLLDDSAYDVVPGFLAEPANEPKAGAPPELAVIMALQKIEE